MVARNDITGDAIISRKTGDKFRDGWDRIFKKTDETITEKEQEDDQAIRDSAQSDG